MNPSILVVDDMEINRRHLESILRIDGYEVDSVADGREAWKRIRARKYHLIITDLRMPELSGLDLLAMVRNEHMPAGVILLTAFGEPEDALRAMKAGADDFLTKPLDADHLRFLVKRILERRAMIDELERLKRQTRGVYHFQTMISKSPRVRRVFDLIEQVGPTGSTVLVQGETGTGKELVAQAIHSADTRRSGPFIALNCAVLNDSLLESELFGHERGAFTGAEKRNIGRFEQAHGGTLLLDEVGDIPPLLQAKLLRVLQSGTFERLGGAETIKVDVRIVAATHRGLDEEVKMGRFRADLFYRLNVVKIELPPLRERTEDIPLLATHFLEKHRPAGGGSTTEISSEAMRSLVRYSWPGNIRELENAIKSGLTLAEGGVLGINDLPESVVPRSTSGPRTGALLDVNRPLPDLTDELISQVERDYFSKLLAMYKGNVARCARHSGLSRRSVTQKLSKLGLERKSYKNPLEAVSTTA